MEQFSSPKHMRENEFVQFDAVYVTTMCVGCSPAFHNKGVCMWKISVETFSLFSLSLEFIFNLHLDKEIDISLGKIKPYKA